MAWNTKGIYKNLSRDAESFLKSFDKDWQKKRAYTDALNHDCVEFKNQATHEEIETLEDPLTDALLILMHQRVKKISHPKKHNFQFFLLVHTDERKFRVYFETLEAAIQAYEAFLEFSLWISKD